MCGPRVGADAVASLYSTPSWEPSRYHPRVTSRCPVLSGPGPSPRPCGSGLQYLNLLLLIIGNTALLKTRAAGGPTKMRSVSETKNVSCVVLGLGPIS